MNPQSLYLDALPRFQGGQMILGLSGWMDGGEVSTGTVGWIVDRDEVEKVGSIDPEGFYLYSFPGSMEIAALFRPDCRIEDGLVQSYEPPLSELFADETNGLLLLGGKEPHLHWRRFADAIFQAADRWDIQEIYFVGSVAGAVPHTREPRIRGAASGENARRSLMDAGVELTQYEGPAAFVTYLLVEAERRERELLSLVTEIPAYIQGRNPRAVEVLLRKLSGLIGLGLDLDPLRRLGDQWEKRIDEAVQEREDLAEHIEKLEHDYDNEVFDTQMGDLKDWLEERGIQVD